MRLYFLRVRTFAGYDSYDGKVISAPSPAAARRMANVTTGGEGKIWQDAKKTTCTCIGTSSIGQAVVLQSYCAG